MNQKIQLKIGKFPKAMGALVHSNQFLKISALAYLGFCVLLIGYQFLLLTKPPTILTMSPNAEPYRVVDPPKPEREVEEAVRAYLDHRYKWEPQTVGKRLQEAGAFILPQSRVGFEKAMGDVVRFSTEKAVSQKVYPDKVTVNLEKRTVSISGDRVTAIQGMKAAGDLRLELSFDSGPRTVLNPWGVYITKEKEE
jgi:hypothetical protein